ncbi:hypothetical protein [Sinorhizobium mexicanum]|uniref:hypothetical protein n=1 Tax=Sinorhizobium mexicanum TaxID=375549 RepID=UPI0015DFB780|nr:hypothetical protein [Sinorhizobium mexicanum]MBP1886503.1 hypothetical protein [Sinorhizobium mexicanum]
MVAAVLVALAPLSAHSASNTVRAVEEFHHICLAEGPDFLRMSQDAYGRDWELLAEVAFDDLAPIANPDMVRVWLTTKPDGGLPAGTIIAFTEASLDGKPVHTCTLALPHIDPGEFQKAFFTRTDAEKISEERSSAEVNRLYILMVSGRQQFVRMVLPTSSTSGKPLIVASSIMRRDIVEKNGTNE